MPRYRGAAVPPSRGGQRDALARALEGDADSGPVLPQIAAIRGALNGLMSEVLKVHISEGFGQLSSSEVERAERVKELLGLVRSYLE